MIPVMQTKLYSEDGIHNGNCMAACLASLLEIPLWMVPPFEDMFARTDHTTRRDNWLTRFFGIELEYTTIKMIEEGVVLPEFYIAVGPSARGVHHAVIYSNGKMVHDPHYSQEGIINVTGLYVPMPARPEDIPTGNDDPSGRWRFLCKTQSDMMQQMSERLENRRTPTQLLNIVSELFQKHGIHGKGAADFLYDFNTAVRQSVNNVSTVNKESE